MSRVMTAPEWWDEPHVGTVLMTHDGANFTHGVVRVRVEEIREDEPDLSVGDGVRVGGMYEATVTGAPYWSEYHKRWRAEVDGPAAVTVVSCDTMTKLPPTASRLIRITGDEELVGLAYTDITANWPALTVEEVADHG